MSMGTGACPGCTGMMIDYHCQCCGVALNPKAIDDATRAKIGKYLGIAAIIIVLWKITMEFPKVWNQAKSNEEKWSAMTVLM